MYLCKPTKQMSDTYKTISSLSEGLYKEKGSRFISFAVPVDSLETIKELLNDYRKQFYDARHVCYAYMLGAERIDFRVNDDGEPSGTAGRPILGQINSNGLTNILIVVVRYFGGVLLGTGGLVTAYKEAAADAIRNAEIVERTVERYFKISFDYIYMNDVMKTVKETNAQISRQGYDQNCVLELSIRKNDADTLSEKLHKINTVYLQEK